MRGSRRGADMARPTKLTSQMPCGRCRAINVACTFDVPGGKLADGQIAPDDPCVRQSGGSADDLRFGCRLTSAIDRRLTTLEGAVLPHVEGRLQDFESRTHPSPGPSSTPLPAHAYTPSGSYTPVLPPPDYGYGASGPMAGPSGGRPTGGLPGYAPAQLPSPFLPSGSFIPPPFYGMPQPAPWGPPLPHFNASSPKRQRSRSPPVESSKRLNMSGQFLTNPSDARVRRLSPPPQHPRPTGFSMPSRVADRPDVVAKGVVEEPAARFYFTTCVCPLDRADRAASSSAAAIVYRGRTRR